MQIRIGTQGGAELRVPRISALPWLGDTSPLGKRQTTCSEACRDLESALAAR